MGRLSGLRARFRALLHPIDADRDLADEVRFHVELETEKNIRLGATRDEARRLAIAHFGGMQSVREEHRDVRRLVWIEDFASDVRFALRTLRRTPVLAAAAIITIALGIGANMAIFSAVNAVILQPLPFPDAGRLMMLAEENPEKHWHLQQAAPANYLDWRASVPAFEDVAAYDDSKGQLVTLTGRGDPRLLHIAVVTGNLFSTLGVRAEIGRALDDAETWKTAARVAVLSHRAWQREFGGNPSIVGQTVTLDGLPFQIVGVMPAGFAFPWEDVDIWAPERWNLADRSQIWFRRAHWLRVVARLRPGVTPVAANAQLQQVVGRLKRDYPETNKYMGASMTPLHDFLVGDTRLPLLVLLGAVGLLLLIACANVGNLMLVRAAGRQREVALRLALGARRSRLARQAVTESLVLSAMGGALGLALGWAGTHALVALQPPGMLRTQDFSVDQTVVLYVVLITIASGCLFGIAPALWTRARGPAEALNDGARGGTQSPRVRRWGNALVVGEVALALIMTVGAGLLVRSLWQMGQVKPGFDSHGVLAADVSLSNSYDSVAKVSAFYDQLLERARAIPGVTEAGLTSSLPLTGKSWTSDFIAQGRPANDYGTEVYHWTASPGYFATMRVPLLAGRLFTAADGRGSPPVVVINKALATSYFAGRDPVGQRIAFDKVPTPQSPWYTIVGVVGDEHDSALDSPPKIAVIESATQSPTSDMFLVVKTGGTAGIAGTVAAYGDPAALAAPVRAIVHDLDPRLALISVNTMDEIRGQSMARARFLTTLLLVFAIVGLTLSVVGVYGVVAQLARNRTREMGIRIALGAQARQVRWLVVRHALGLTAAGLVCGGAVALVSTRVMTSLLFDVAPNDPWTLAAVACLLAGTSVLASWVPAVKASRADPTVALRGD